MNEKKGLLGYLAVGFLGAVAGAASFFGISKFGPKIMEKCCCKPEVKEKKRKK
jgi:hypothetical protein